MKTDYKFDNSKDKYGNEKHLHTLRGRALKGSTSLIKEVMPPPLAWYGSGRACRFLGWYDKKESRSNYMTDEEGMPKLKEMFEKIKDMEDPEEYRKLLTKAYKAHNEYKKKKGRWGSKVHEAVEDIVKGAIEEEGFVLGSVETDDDIQEAVDEFVKWADGKKFLGSETHVFSEEIWCGGIVDLVFEKDGDVFLGDIKTSKSIYPSQFIQMGLYDFEQAENGFVDKNGKVIGKPKDIKGYTLINLPQRGGSRVETWNDTKGLREFAENLAQLHEKLNQLEEFIN